MESTADMPIMDDNATIEKLTKSKTLLVWKFQIVIVLKTTRLHII